MLAAGVREEVLRAHAAGASATARKALGFEELLAGDVEAMQRRTRNYARRQLTWMRKLAGVHLIDVTGRAPEERRRGDRSRLQPRMTDSRHARAIERHAHGTPMRFEKWQALGNDYLIVERASCRSS